MKRFIKWALGHLPRPLMQCLAGWMVPLYGLLLRGKGKECPICNTHFRKMLPYGYVTPRDNALCPSCLSLERHRLLWLWLKRETKLFEELPTLLHIAPEQCLMKHFREVYHNDSKRYVTADLESPLAELHFDVEQIPLKDNTFDVVICNHLLEHVSNDRRALGELWRILKPGGWGVVLSPIDYNRKETFEDDSITDEKERTRLFGQYDHRRVYGCDYTKRLEEAGFLAQEIDYAQTFSKEEQMRYSFSNDRLYIIRKPLS